jgi:hypothetical protein
MFVSKCRDICVNVDYQGTWIFDVLDMKEIISFGTNYCIFYTLDHKCRVRAPLSKAERKPTFHATFYISFLHSPFLCFSVIMCFIPVTFYCLNILVFFLHQLFSPSLLWQIISSLIYSRTRVLNKIRPKQKESRKSYFPTNCLFMFHYFQFALLRWRIVSFLPVQLRSVWLNISGFWEIFRYIQVSVRFKLCFRKFNCTIQVRYFLMTRSNVPIFISNSQTQM